MCVHEMQFRLASQFPFLERSPLWCKREAFGGLRFFGHGIEETYERKLLEGGIIFTVGPRGNDRRRLECSACCQRRPSPAPCRRRCRSLFHSLAGRRRPIVGAGFVASGATTLRLSSEGGTRRQDIGADSEYNERFVSSFIMPSPWSAIRRWTVLLSGL